MAIIRTARVQLVRHATEGGRLRRPAPERHRPGQGLRFRCPPEGGKENAAARFARLE
ncbi:hypothetical protein [Streptomyces sp. NPDC001843]|uniref:hypothetical protein n=1 Tax=Streptomyces sp. NPDC001843 TaxID=3364617 RepID=UPI0036C72E90